MEIVNSSSLEVKLSGAALLICADKDGFLPTALVNCMKYGYVSWAHGTFLSIR